MKGRRGLELKGRRGKFVRWIATYGPLSLGGGIEGQRTTRLYGTDVYSLT